MAQRPELLDILSDPPVREGKRLSLEEMLRDSADLQGLLHPTFLRRYLAMPWGARFCVWDEARELRRQLAQLGRVGYEPHVIGERALRELRAACGRESEAPRTREERTGAPDAVLPGFPPAPILENANIRHLCTGAELRGEGAVMKHCVGGYIRSVEMDAKRFYAVHHPERVTVSVVPRGDRWEIDDIRGPRNANPQAETVRVLHEWAATTPQRPAVRNRAVGEIARLLGQMQPPVAGLAPHVRLVTAGTEVGRADVCWLRSRYRWREHAPHNELENDGHHWNAPLHSALTEMHAKSHTIRYEWNPLWQELTCEKWQEAKSARLFERMLSQAA